MAISNLILPKQFFIIVIFAFACFNLNAQSYIGFLSDNYSGVNRVINNPANIVDTPYNFDLNLIGVSTIFSNDAYASESLSVLTDDNFEFPDSLSESFTNDNFAYSYTDVLGPSLMINLNEKSAIALYTRARAIFNVSGINGSEINQFTDDFDIDTDNFALNNLNTNIAGHAWGEVGLTYARIFKNNNEHFYKGGVTLKYLVGLGSGYAQTQNLTANYIANGDDILDNLADGNITLDGNLNYGLSYGELEDEFKFDELEKPRSLGLDIGAVYEWRPDYQDYYITDKKGNKVLDRTKNKYKLRVGVSISDIGSIKYTEGTLNGLDINATTLEFVGDLNAANDFNDIQTVLNDNQYADLINNATSGTSFEDLVTQLQNANNLAEAELILQNNEDELSTLLDDLENFENLDDILTDFNVVSLTTQDSEIKTVLPTLLRLDADWSFNKNLYLNMATNISLTSRSKTGRNAIANELRVTPRYESRVFSLFSPIRLVQGNGLLWGLGFRLGPLYVGSGSALSNVLIGNIEAGDVFAGLKIPGLKSRSRDKDGDGVKDRRDQCPDTPGPKENDGCPWPDSDNDGVIDKDDECEDTPGPEENNGCPWPDTDGDTVPDKDDDCVDIPGPIENGGCPWPDADNDGVPDAEDQCPNIAGEVAHNGCPDTDGDNIIDTEDECPDVAGTIANKGCPEVTETVQKELNSFAKTILFDSGRASIKVESAKVMAEIIKILKEYPNAKFVIEGHTDSIGSAPHNQTLSEKRAKSVLQFLIEKGIDAQRLSAIGYGEKKPIATNMYKHGRKQNRRVEINLIK
ncbi:DUF5723 family protein [Flagellimonas onchidii]|uniref:DUF5723 family protein n=1 Tax=Flagellimonas onchidii TaxID=2562684 RepID=UPI001F1043B1|nr:DUF5723 family protein [Allomuricauda onchidii]